MIQTHMTDTTQQLDAQFIEQIETDLLQHIIEGLQSRNLSVDDAQKVAADFLMILSSSDKQELLNKLNELGKTYKPAQETYVDIAVPLQEQQRADKLTAMRDHIKSGNIEAAIAVAKGEQ